MTTSVFQTAMIVWMKEGGIYAYLGKSETNTLELNFLPA